MPHRQIPEADEGDGAVKDEVFSYMCNLAMEKCSRKLEKKRASCGGAAMRKRLLLKNFVAQMLTKDRQSSTLEEDDLDLDFDISETEESNDHETSMDGQFDLANSEETLSEQRTSDTAFDLFSDINQQPANENGKQLEAEKNLQLNIDERPTTTGASIMDCKMPQISAEEKDLRNEYDWDLEDSFTILSPPLGYMQNNLDGQFDLNRGYVSYDYYTPLENATQYSCSLQMVPSESPPSDPQTAEIEVDTFVEKTDCNDNTPPRMNSCRPSAVSYEHYIVDLDTKAVVDEHPMGDVSVSCRLSRKRPISALDKLDESLSQMMMLTKRVKL